MMKWKFRIGAVMGNALEYYDVAVFAAISTYLSTELERQGYSQATEMVWGIFALRFIIRPVGGYVIGRYADRVGKKPALILTSLITGTATLCMALLPIELLGAYTPAVMLILQMALSFSFAGEYPSLITYLFNTTDSNERSRVSSLVVGSSTLGVIASLGLLFILEHTLDMETMQDIGWRLPLLLGVVNILISFWFRAKLPNQLANKEAHYSINWRKLLHIFLLTVPGSVIFYSQNISSSLILKYLNVGEFKSMYAITSASLLLCFILVCGWLTDKYSSSSRVFNIGVAGMVIFSVPLYFVMRSDILELILLAQLMMTIYTSMILCNLSSVIAEFADGQVTTLSLGYNIASTMIGGITPLIISYLLGIDLVYVGAFVAVCGLTLLLSCKLPRS